MLLAALVGVNIYRAATQSITTDEAFTYIRSVAVPIPDLWEDFDANDHVLHTLLCKVSVKLFGLSELSMRIPSLLGGVYLFICFSALSSYLFGAGNLMLLSVALLSLNPLILDYASIARGYGMATALFLFSLYHAMRYLREPFSQWRLYAIGIGLALGVAANLTILFPGVALVTAMALLHLIPPLHKRNHPQFAIRLGNLLDHMIVPGIIAIVVMMLVPMLPARRAHFYFGAGDLAEAAVQIALASLWRTNNVFDHTRFAPGIAHAVEMVALTLLPAVIAASTAWMAWGFRKRTAGKGEAREEAFTLLALTVMVLLLILIAADYLAGLPYPYRRTGLYFIPLFTLLAVTGFSLAWRPLRRGGVVVAAVLLFQFLTGFTVRFYEDWLSDAGNREIMEYLRAQRPAPGSKLSIGVSPPLQSSVEFYRRLFAMDWLESPLKEPRWDKKYDWYYLSDQDYGLIQKLGLDLHWEHALSKVRLAKAPSSTPR